MDDLFGHVQERARQSVGDLTDQDEDIMPMFLWVSEHGLGMMPLTPMRSQEDKDKLAMAMLATLVCSLATEAAAVTTSWTLKVDAPEGATLGAEMLNVGMPADHPNRVECISVMYTHVTKGAKMASAPLTRYPDKPPTLGEWDVNEFADGRLGGRFGDAMTDGLKMVQSVPGEILPLIEQAWADGSEQELMRAFLKVFGQLDGGVVKVTLEDIEGTAG